MVTFMMLLNKNVLDQKAKGNIAAWRDVAKQVVYMDLKANYGIQGYLRTTRSKTIPTGELDYFSEILTAETKLHGKDPTGSAKFS
jgi:hypothetical protein